MYYMFAYRSRFAYQVENGSRAEFVMVINLIKFLINRLVLNQQIKEIL